MRIKKPKKFSKKQDSIQVKLKGADEVKLLNGVKLMMQDANLNTPSYRETMLYCLGVVKAQLSQEKGASSE